MTISTQTASILVSVASVIFAAALTIVTYWYYVETKKQTTELKKTREADFKPVLTPTVMADGLEIYLAVENTGNGAAHDVRMSWRFEDQEDKTDWKSPLVSADERHKFYLPFETEGSRVVVPEQVIDELDEGEMLEFEAHYDDSLGNEHSSTEELDVREIVSKRRESGGIPEKASEVRIANELQDLNRRLNNIQNTWEVNNFLRSANSRRILEVIDEYGPLTVGDIIDATSIKDRSVQRHLMNLSDAGIVELEGEEASPYNRDTVISLNS